MAVNKNKKRVHDEIVEVKKEISELKEILSEEYLKNQAQLKGDVDVIKLRVGQLSKLKPRLKLLVDKYREQKAQMKLLVELLRGKWENVKCECGRMVKTLSVQGEEEKKKTKKRKVKTPSSDDCSSDQQDFSSNTEHYKYSDDQLTRIGSVIPELVDWGPLDSLTSTGMYEFHLAKDDVDVWPDIRQRREEWMHSRPFLLPAGLVSGDGITLVACLTGIEQRHNDEFDISFFAPDIPNNRTVRLPVVFSVRAYLKLLEGESLYRSSEMRIFQIEALDYDAVGAEFRMNFDNTAAGDSMPQLLLKFGSFNNIQ